MRPNIDASHVIFISQFTSASLITQLKLNLARIRPSDLWPASFTQWLRWQAQNCRLREITECQCMCCQGQTREVGDIGNSKLPQHQITWLNSWFTMTRNQSWCTLHCQRRFLMITRIFCIPDLNPTTQAGIEKQTKLVSRVFPALNLCTTETNTAEVSRSEKIAYMVCNAYLCRKTESCFVT